MLNRALADRDTGLFADVDVTLLPEATSTRAIRALGKFFGTAARDDVLLVYFSGHGKLDQSGRLHLCMQDTDSTDLLSSAVSSARINEFADASRARNVVIVLDCCHAGAFRGGDLGDAVAGPGRYVMTSCRGTQLANDATVENGSSYFTQHLVDGLLDAAADRDGDGYVTFSDLYAYVDRRLREASKQIPQRRVNGDGDLRLAKRPLPASPEVSPGAPPPVRQMPPSRPGSESGTAAGNSASGAARGACRPRPGWARRKVQLAVAAATAAIGAVVAALVLLFGGSDGNPRTGATFHTKGNSLTAGAPWRLKLVDEGYGPGCSITLIASRSGTPILQVGGQYGSSTLQIHQTGSFRWRVNDPRCHAAALPGSGSLKLPFSWDQSDIGDTDAFAAPDRVAVQVKDFRGSECKFTLYGQTDGQELDLETATRGKNETARLNPGQRKTVYLGTDDCVFRVYAAP